MTTRDLAIQQLRNVGISPSGPRVAVFTYLIENRIHPTVDTIYRSLSAEYPTLSRTTVYNTLKLLSSKNLVQSLMIEEGELRFDACTQFHAHFKCAICGKVLDMPPMEEPPAPVLPGAQISYAQLNYYGICPDCSTSHRPN